MPNQSTCGAPRLVRLNALTNPPSPAEDRWLAHYGLGLERVEANDPDAILNCAADCDVLFVVATALPPAVINGLANCRLISRLGNGTDKIAVDAVEAAGEMAAQVIEKVVHRAVRQKLPRTRTSKTFEFRVADCKGFVTVGEYDDGRPGEIFVRVSKQGSTLAGIVDAFAVSLSHGLQYGVPLTAFVEAYVGMRFEPAGMTDDPDIRIATSLMDYLFRKLAIMYLDYDERAALGILATDETGLTAGIERLLVDAHEWASASNAAVVAAQRLSWNASAGQLLDLLVSDARRRAAT